MKRTTTIDVEYDEAPYKGDLMVLTAALTFDIDVCPGDRDTPSAASVELIECDAELSDEDGDTVKFTSVATFCAYCECEGRTDKRFRQWAEGLEDQALEKANESD